MTGHRDSCAWLCNGLLNCRYAGCVMAYSPKDMLGCVIDNSPKDVLGCVMAYLPRICLAE